MICVHVPGRLVKCCCAVKVAYVDTLHLFPETNEFLQKVEERYQFTALRYLPKVRCCLQLFQLCAYIQDVMQEHTHSCMSENCCSFLEVSHGELRWRVLCRTLHPMKSTRRCMAWTSRFGTSKSMLLSCKQPCYAARPGNFLLFLTANIQHLRPLFKDACCSVWFTVL